MNRKKVAKASAIIGLLSQVIVTVITFFSRKIFLKYLGVELLGLISTLTQILGALALSELGIQTVVIYRLFKPVVDKNENEINQIISFFRNVYKVIAAIIMAGGFVLTPFLRFFLKDVQIDNSSLILVWGLLVLSSSASYILSYNRAIFFADQKEYMIKIIDLFCTIFFTSLKIAIVIYTRNLFLFVAAGLFSNVISNLIIIVLRKKYYPNIAKCRPNSAIRKSIFGDVKNVFSGKIAGYVFNSTDSIVVSSLIGTSLVGCMGNYTTITIALKGIISSIASPIQNIIGNYLAEKKKNSIETIFLNYSFIIYLLTLGLFLPTGLLIDDFVSLFYGNQFKLSSGFVICLILSEYSSLMQIPAGALVDASGLYKEEKKFLLISAIINLSVSVIGALTIGLIGVLIGTIIGNLFNWFMRALYAYKKVIESKEWNKYLFNNIVFLFFFGILFLTFKIVFNKLFLNITIAHFIIKGLLIEIIVVALSFLLFHSRPEFDFLLSFFNLRKNHK